MEVLSLKQLCNEHWRSTTPSTVRKNIERGENYPFLFKVGKMWLANLEDFNKWVTKNQEQHNKRRR